MKLRELTEAPVSYGQEGKPEWFDRAVKLKLDNPHITASEIARQVDSAPSTVLYWLTGFGRETARMIDRPKDSLPFQIGDFPHNPTRKYFDGAKPEWYNQALQMAKAGETFIAIAKKFGVNHTTIGQWLVKGRKSKHGKLINPDAELEPRRIAGQKLDVKLLNDLVADPDLNDTDILELIADEYGKTAASTVKTMLPQLRQKQKASMSTNPVLDKTASGLNNPVARPPKVNIPDS